MWARGVEPLEEGGERWQAAWRAGGGVGADGSTCDTLTSVSSQWRVACTLLRHGVLMSCTPFYYCPNHSQVLPCRISNYLCTLQLLEWGVLLSCSETVAYTV